MPFPRCERPCLRSVPLAGRVAICRAGGYIKDETPYTEFLWVDFLRRRIGRKSVQSKCEKALD